MNALDLFFAVVFLLPVVFGFFAGFLRVFFALLSWGLSVLLAAQLMPQASAWLLDYVSSPVLLPILAFFALFIPAFFLCSLGSYFMIRLFRMRSDGLDRMLGLCFGTMLGVVLVFATVFIAGFSRLPKHEVWQQSVLAYPLQGLAQSVAAYVLPARARMYHFYESQELLRPHPAAGQDAVPVLRQTWEMQTQSLQQDDEGTNAMPYPDQEWDTLYPEQSDDAAAEWSQTLPLYDQEPDWQDRK